MSLAPLTRWTLLMGFLLRTGDAVSLPPGYTAPGQSKRLEWSYADVAQWPTKFPQYCAGQKQSPINLDRFTARFKLLEPLVFTDYGVIPTSQTVLNNAHTVVVTFTTTTAVPKISKGALPDNGPYSLAQFHLHWGADDLQGSEHTIGGVRYPLELHMVHFKTKYGTLTDSIQHSDGLAVLGVMFEISEQDNPALGPLLTQVAKVTTAAATSTATDLYALSSLLPKDVSRFYRYSGGLTTPTCNEIVTWTVFQDPIHVSKEQMKVFRTMLDSKGQALVNNYRPPQPLNSRTVYRTFV